MHHVGVAQSRSKVIAATAAAAALVAAGGGALLTSGQAATAASAVPSQTGCKSSKGTLTYGIAGAGITQLDPNTISFAGQAPLQTLLYNGLWKYDRNMNVVSDLATKWRASKDLKTWVVTLRRGVKYSTGRTFAAADARANILRVLDPAVPSQQRTNAKDIRSVRVISPYRLRIRLGSPSAILPAALVDIKMSDTKNVADLARSGTGTGPYRVGSFTPNQWLTLVPNPHHFGGRACLQRITFVRTPDPTAMVTAFRSGSLDMIWQVRPTDVPALRAGRKRFLAPKEVSGVHVWEVDTSSEPFNDVRVRRALSYAIDRRTMIRVAFSGIASPSLGNSLINADSSAYNKKLTPYTFNLRRARQLFAAGGVKPGTTFTFWALAGRRDEWITMAQILREDLRKIGLNLSIQRSDVSTWLAKFFPAGKKYPNTIVGNYFSLPPNPTFALRQGQFGSCECNWRNNMFEARARRAPGIVNSAARQKVYDTMQQIFSMNAPLMVIAHQTNIVAYQDKVKNAWEDAQGNVHLEQAWISG